MMQSKGRKKKKFENQHQNQMETDYGAIRHEDYHYCSTQAGYISNHIYTEYTSANFYANKFN